MRFTIGAKLIGLVTLILLVSITVLVGLSTELFIEDNASLVQQMNADTAAGLASQIRTQLDAYLEQFEVLGESWLQEINGSGKKGLVHRFIENRSDVLMLHLYENDFKGTAKLKAEYFAEGTTGEAIDRREQMTLLTSLVTEERPDRTPAQKPPRIEVMKLAGQKCLALIVPLSNSYYLIGWIGFQRLTEPLLASDIAGSFLVDKNGLVLVRSDGKFPQPGEFIPTIDSLKRLQKENLSNGHTVFEDPKLGIRRLIAFRSVGAGNLMIMTEVPEFKALEGVDRLQFRAKMVAIVVLCLSLVAGFYLAESISHPLRELVDAAERISVGDYQIQLKPRSRDEVGDLALAFNAMAAGLEERNVVKETFSKFYNKEIAEQLLSGKVRLGGERKEAAVLFMDIRDFTKMSEEMEPEKVVLMLNEYMTRMVALIRTYGGIVDKYMGDAIMAVWGVPEGHLEDCYRAVRCCLELREELHRLNAERLARDEMPLRIGMGLNYGKVIAGNIGSPKKMEYTVVGDAVNVASRLESATKNYQTDFLISRSVHDAVKRRFVFEACPNAKVKGKVNEVEIFKVKGYLSENGNPVLVPEYREEPQQKPSRKPKVA